MYDTFVKPRPSRTKKAVDVCKTSKFDIFCIFGVPMILQSAIGREFVNKIIEDSKLTWDRLKIMDGKPRHDQL